MGITALSRWLFRFCRRVAPALASAPRTKRPSRRRAAVLLRRELALLFHRCVQQPNHFLQAPDVIRDACCPCGLARAASCDSGRSCNLSRSVCADSQRPLQSHRLSARTAVLPPMPPARRQRQREDHMRVAIFQQRKITATAISAIPALVISMPHRKSKFIRRPRQTTPLTILCPILANSERNGSSGVADP